MSVRPDELREIGRIVRPHGVLGELKVAPETDDPDRILHLNRVYIGGDEYSASPFDIRSIRTQVSKYGITIILALEGLSDRSAADAFRNRTVYAGVDDLPPLEEGEYFISDLVGLSVNTEDGTLIGTIRDVLDLPTQKLLVLHRENADDAMIPLVPEFVTDIDIGAGRVIVRPIEGLI